jgi:NAD(P)-dependent dehydrogenase (short-subunit alcohol dehydrogenase family)
MTWASLKDKVALVTGAGGGIGTALVQRFIAEGVRVVAADLDVARAQAAIGDDANSRAVAIDVTSEESVRGLVAEIGDIDIVVNNAGIYPAQKFEEMQLADWRRIMAVNLDGAFLVSHAAFPSMRRKQWGRIVNISSGTVWLGTARYVHYAAAKAGIIGFTRSLASELGEFGITVNAVSPGLTNTETLLRGVAPELLEQRRLQRPLKRHQFARDVIGAIVFLASDDADFITGQTINVDGGAAMH